MIEHFCDYDLNVYFDENSYPNEQEYSLCWKNVRAKIKKQEDFYIGLSSCLSDCLIKDIDFVRIDMRFWRPRPEEIVSAKRLASDKRWIRTKSSRYDNMKGIQRLRFSQDTVYCSVRKNGAWQETAAPYYVGKDKKFKEEKWEIKYQVATSPSRQTPKSRRCFPSSSSRTAVCASVPERRGS